MGGLSSDKGKALGVGCGRCLWLVWSSGFNGVVSILGANLSFGVGSENEIYVLPSSAQDGPNCDLPAPWRHLRAVQGCISLPNSLTSCPALRHQSSFEHVPSQLISSFPSTVFAGKVHVPSEMGAECGGLCLPLSAPFPPSYSTNAH